MNGGKRCRLVGYAGRMKTIPMPEESHAPRLIERHLMRHAITERAMNERRIVREM